MLRKHVYPRNKYHPPLQMTRLGKGANCENVFSTMVYLSPKGSTQSMH